MNSATSDLYILIGFIYLVAVTVGFFVYLEWLNHKTPIAPQPKTEIVTQSYYVDTSSSALLAALAVVAVTAVTVAAIERQQSLLRSRTINKPANMKNPAPADAGGVE